MLVYLLRATLLQNPLQQTAASHWNFKFDYLDWITFVVPVPRLAVVHMAIRLVTILDKNQMTGKETRRKQFYQVYCLHNKTSLSTFSKAHLWFWFDHFTLLNRARQFYNRQAKGQLDE